MMNLGGFEILLACFGGLFSLVVPAAFLIFLYLIYDRLGKIEQALKKDED